MWDLWWTKWHWEVNVGFVVDKVALGSQCGICGGQSGTGKSMWDLWWTKWYWEVYVRFVVDKVALGSHVGFVVDKVALGQVFSEYFGFPLSISFHRCSITRKKRNNLIIFITGLHNKPSTLRCFRNFCCGAPSIKFNLMKKGSSVRPAGRVAFQNIFRFS
jgi:hypothetical protein